ncbi:hypothetical protein DFH28DRAFT_1119458 [Melampsora americana]|nr:hypothetical protein DFH28DRAFT_1119458 [Melampsora americana]
MYLLLRVILEEVSTSNTSTSRPPKQTGTTARPPNKKRQGTTPQRNPILLRSLSKPNNECSRCRTIDVVNQKTSYCHCGSKIRLPKGRVEAAQNHWKSRACKDHTERMKANEVLSSWVTVTTIKKTIEMPCSGLTDESWERPRSKYTIADCIKHSPMPYHGAKRWKKQLHNTLEARAVWRIWQHGEQASIHSAQCTNKVECCAGTLHPICDKCDELKSVRSFIKAINTLYATDENIKYIPKVLMTGDQFQAVLRKFTELQILQKSLEKATAQGDQEFWTAIGTYRKAGLFKDTSSISSRSLKFFNDNFAGRSAWSMRPVAAATNETVCVKSLRHYNGFIVGAQGGDISFVDGNDIEKIVKSTVSSGNLCSKIRAYTIQVPLPNMFTFIVAVIASQSKENASDVAAQHHTFFRECELAGINVLSLGSDGAPTELAAQEQIIDSTTQYLTYINEDFDVSVKVPLLGKKLMPAVLIQDPKHARKTAANQLLSGSCVLSFGRYYVDIQQLATLLQDVNSPIYKHDVFDCDRQDDGRAYRTFSANTLEAALKHEECVGLANEPHSLMSVSANGISPQSFKIFSTMALRLIGLMISHRQFYPSIPLMPWKHGTEPLEHAFGWMQVISPNYSKDSCCSQESGYKHAFANEKAPTHTNLFCQFPSDEEITFELNAAKKYATSLATFVGMHNSPVHLTTQALELLSLSTVSLPQSSTLDLSSTNSTNHPTSTSTQMDPDPIEHTLPVPDVIEINDIDRRQMDEYVDAFGAPQHGYRIRIANWKAGSHLCHYECYRSGFPPGKPKTTKSLRIGCQFCLNARFLPTKRSWILIHTHLGHNHPADPNVPRRKKAVTTKPILPHPYHLIIEPQHHDEQSPAPELQVSRHTGASITPIRSIDPKALIAPKASINPNALIELTVSTLRNRLQVLTPCRRQEVIFKINSIFTDQDCYPSNPTANHSASQAPIPPSEYPTNPKSYSLSFNSPKSIPPTTIDEILKVSPAPSARRDPEPPLNEDSVDTLIDEFFGLSENTNSTFNIEDLVFHSDSKVQESNPSPQSTKVIESLLESTTTIVDHKPTHGDIKSPNFNVCKPIEVAKPPLKKKTSPPEPRMTRKRAREQPEPRMTRKRARERSIGYPHFETEDMAKEVAKAPLTTHTTTLPLAPIRRLTRKQARQQNVGNTLPNTKEATQPVASNFATSAKAPSGRMKGTTSFVNSTLPALLKRYQIQHWLIPFVLNLHEVDADGHCGFRAIAVSIGRSQDDWLYVRQSLINTLERWPNVFSDSRLPEERTSLLKRLRTKQANVLSSDEHWLSMPGIGGVIATTFDRPVLYYETGNSSNQVVFPYLTPVNDNPPIALVWSEHHFASLTLDYKNPNLPVPKVCSTWDRFRSLMASTWLPPWKPMIEKHAAFLDSQNKGTRGKKRLETQSY